jgi:hypothetical protein
MGVKCSTSSSTILCYTSSQKKIQKTFHSYFDFIKLVNQQTYHHVITVTIKMLYFTPFHHIQTTHHYSIDCTYVISKTNLSAWRGFKYQALPAAEAVSTSDLYFSMQNCTGFENNNNSVVFHYFPSSL